MTREVKIIRTLYLLTAVLGVFLAAILLENWMSKPGWNCNRFETDTQYVGYHCKGQDIYIPPQN